MSSDDEDSDSYVTDSDDDDYDSDNDSVDVHISSLSEFCRDNCGEWGWRLKDRNKDEGDERTHELIDEFVMLGGDEQIIPRGSPAGFSKEDWRKVGDAICNSRNRGVLGRLNFKDCHLTDEYADVMFGESRVYKKSISLSRLNLSKNGLGPLGVKAVVPLLMSTWRTKRLNLNETNMGDAGATLLSEALRRVQVEELHLSQCQIGDGGVECLLSAENARKIIKLNLDQNNIGQRGFEFISRFLGRDDTWLKKLYLSSYTSGGDRAYDKKYAKMLVESISSKSELEVFDFGWESRELGKLEKSILNLICNRSSFDSICNSNHRLRWFGDETMNRIERGDCSKVYGDAMNVNARSKYGVSVAERIRSKLRAYYFENERQFDLQPFLEMDIILMPYALQLVTMTGICVDRNQRKLGSGRYYKAHSLDLNNVFRIIRNCHLPELFSFPRPLTQEHFEAKIQELEAENAALKLKNKKLVEENEELQGCPKKRPKTSDA